MKLVFTMRVVKLLLYACGGVVYVRMLGGLCMYVEFAFVWCVGGCNNVGAILAIGGVPMVCVSHCVVLLLRIFVVVGYLCEV